MQEEKLGKFGLCGKENWENLACTRGKIGKFWFLTLLGNQDEYHYFYFYWDLINLTIRFII